MPQDTTPKPGEIRSGRVIAKAPEIGTGYVVEEGTNRQFAFSRRFVGEALFNALGVGARVRFQDNGHNAIAALLD